LRAGGARIDALLSSGRIAVSECDLLYESVLLNAVARFEGLLNQLLEEFVCGAASRSTGHFRLLAPRSRDNFRRVLTAGKPYVDLMPIGRCVDVASRYLNDGKPFSEISSADKNILDNIVLIRNAIAHRSDSAIKKFRTSVSGVTSLPSARRFPGPYLRHVYRAHPVATWNTLYLDTLETIGLGLARAW
jgi:hypothetical protein